MPVDRQCQLPVDSLGIFARLRTCQTARMSAEARLTELGIDLPVAMTPAGLYRSSVRVGDLIFLSGAGPVKPDGGFVTGKVGGAISLEEGRDAARLVGLQLLAALRAELLSLDNVIQVVKLLGMVNCAPGFNNTPAVIDGCSGLLIEVFGEAGRGARSAVGMAELPFDISVEVEAIVQVRTDPF
jgi:enamine deaminase RidA (YjgF/YER057c/UK114 family)